MQSFIGCVGAQHVPEPIKVSFKVVDGVTSFDSSHFDGIDGRQSGGVRK